MDESSHISFEVGDFIARLGIRIQTCAEQDLEKLMAESRVFFGDAKRSFEDTACWLGALSLLAKSSLRENGRLVLQEEMIGVRQLASLRRRFPDV